MEYPNRREKLGLEISKQFRAVRRINKYLYRVKSQSGNGNYHVKITQIGFECDCKDYVYRGVKCKHVYATELSYALRQEVENVVIPELTLECCPTCKSEGAETNLVTSSDIVVTVAVNGSHLTLDLSECMQRHK